MDRFIIGSCFLAWVGMTAYGIYFSRSQWAILFYTRAEGVITQLRVRQVATVSSDSGDCPTHNELFMAYGFTVGDKYFTGEDEGSAFEYAKDPVSGEQLKQVLYQGKKKEGDAIPVYYNPANPKENSHRRFGFFGGLAFACLGQLFLVLALDLIDRWL